MKTITVALVSLFLISFPSMQTGLRAQFSSPTFKTGPSIMETGVRDWMLTKIKPSVLEEKKAEVPPEKRIWTDVTGKFRIEAELLAVSKDGKSATLRRVDNKKEISLELIKLSAKDREFVREYQKKKADDDFHVEIDLNPTSSKKQYELGVRYTLGLGVPKDPKEAMKWLELASSSNYVPAMRELGRTLLRNAGQDENFFDLLDDKNVDRALKLLQKAADKGDIDAKYHLGEFWSRGGLTPESFVWLQEAKMNGHDDAEKILSERKPSMEKLNSIYQDGDDYVWAGAKTPRQKDENIKNAISCFRLGTYYGHPKSQYRYAIYFIKGGYGVKKDPHTALFLLEAAESTCREDAQLGNKKALSLLGEIYVTKAYMEEVMGRKGSREFERCIDVAIGFLDMAIEKGDAEALYQRGYLMTQNFGSKGKGQEGLRMIRQAAEMGVPRAIDAARNMR